MSLSTRYTAYVQLNLRHSVLLEHPVDDDSIILRN